MSGDAKVLEQNPISAGQSAVAQPQVPVGSASKEAPRISAPMSEFAKPSGAEIMPNIPPEVSGHVRVNNDEPNLTPEHKDLVDHAGPNVTVPSSPSGKILLPMSEEEVAEQLRTGQDDDSRKWYAELVKKIIAWGLKPR